MMLSTIRRLRVPTQTFHKQFTRRFSSLPSGGGHTTAAAARACSFSSSSAASAVAAASSSKDSESVEPPLFSASATTPTYAPSLFERLFLKSTYPRIPLSSAFPHHVQIQEKAATHSTEEEEATVTSLSNGLRIATLPSPSAVSSVGVFVDTGSRYETLHNNGITHFYESMSLKSTSNRTDFRLVREMSKMGALLSVASSRDQLSFSAECLPPFVPALVGTLSDIIQNHIFHYEELLEQKEIYAEEATLRDKNTELQVNDALHEAAYGNKTLGLPLHAPLHHLPIFTCEYLKSYVKSVLTPSKMVITGIGVDHQYLSGLVEAAFTKLGTDTGSDDDRQAAQYIGGEVRQHKRGDTGPVQLALAFETVNWHDDDLYAVCVLQCLMGGGSSFSAGGPGKGMYSRLYNNVLNRYDWAEQAYANIHIYADSGLFVVGGMAQPEKTPNMVETLAREMQRMAGPVESVELQRAKNQMKSAMWLTMENKVLVLEDMAKQVITYGKVMTPKQVIDKIDEVKAEDVQRVAKKMLTTPLSLAAIGNLSYLPRYDHIQGLFKKQGNNGFDRDGREERGSTEQWGQ